MTTVTENKGRTTRQSSKPGKKASSDKNAREVPEALIYEMDKGVPIYYRAYREVLAGTKQPEEIMGSSKIQSYVISMLMKFLYKNLPDEEYVILGNELGLLFDKKSWVACDVAIYRQEALSKTEIDDKYATIPPKVVIEVDTKADLSNFNSDLDYYIQRTNKLFAFGVEKIIWIYTREPRKIMVAAPNADWRITDWTSEIELMPGVSFRLSDLMKK